MSIGVGGLAVYLYVEEREPDAGRLTKDIDIVVRRADLEKIAKAAASFGLQHRHVAGVDMLVRPDQPSGRRAIHLYPEPTLELGLNRRIKGLRLIPLADLIHMKLTSFRAKDETHLKRSRRGRTHHTQRGGRSFADPRRAAGAGSRTRVA